MKIVNIYLQARDYDGGDWHAVDTFADAATADQQLAGARRDDIFHEFRLDDRSYDVPDSDYPDSNYAV